MIDNRTSNLNLPKPHPDNTLEEDVVRLRDALDGADTAIAARQLTSQKGVANGYAGLDGTGKVPAAQLPSYVDDVLEYATLANFPGTGESGKIYVSLNDGKTYRWSGSAYVEISASPGSTDSVTEGSTNLYFTAARALAAVPLATAVAAGLVKPGLGLTVDGSGALNVDGVGQTFEDVLLTVSSNGQTAFTVTYTPGTIDVHLNGVKLNGGGDDYTASSGTGITLSAGANTTDLLVLRKWSNFEVANTYTKAQIDAADALKLNAANPSYSGTFTGGTGVVNFGSGQFYKDASGNVGIGTASPANYAGYRNFAINGTSGGNVDFMAGGVVKGSVGNDADQVYLHSLGGTIALGAAASGETQMQIASTGAQSSVIPGGTTLYPEFKCRAWVNFNGTGTVAIRASGNVSSITDNAVGDYTVNFATAMPNADYAIIGTRSTSTNSRLAAVQHIEGSTYTASAVQLYAKYEQGTGGGSEDPTIFNVAIFR